MPKTEIDYSNTIIYKITCIDTSINHLYVGHTTNFVQRKHAHKQGCTNEKSSNYNCKLYKTIRANGGWNNWIMEIVAFFKCNDHYEARIKEQEYFTSLNATLNSIQPLPKPKPKLTDTQIIEPVLNTKKYCCETCNVTLQNQHLLDVHNNTKKHCKKILGIETTVKNFSGKFVCNYCDYTCSRKNDYDKHILTPKHKNRTKLNTLEQKVAETPKNFVCKNCNKAYNARNSLWYHQKNCKTEDTYEHNVNENMYNGINDKELILMLIKQNAELVKETSDFKSIMMKVLENNEEYYQNYCGGKTDFFK